MSGQWETVGKNKKDKQNVTGKKLSKIEKKNFVENAPKVEDFLPLSQVKSLYDHLDNNKQQVNKKDPVKANKTKENEAKKEKAQKKPQEKKKDVLKEKVPRNLETAISMLNVSDVKSVLEIGKMRYEAVPLIWLKDLASFLNLKLPVDAADLNFTSKSFEHPLCLLSLDIRNVIKEAVRSVPETTLQSFYDFCLPAMADAMAKALPCSGYKILLQLLASQNPSISVANLTKSIALRNSYQNRLSIGQSIMWALGQGGFKDISVGLTVWQEVMLPVCELKNYSRFVLEYLKQLLARHSTSKALSDEKYFLLLDAIFAPTNLAKLPKFVLAELETQAKALKLIVCNGVSANRMHQFFHRLFSRLSSKPPPSAALKNELLDFLVDCLGKNTECYGLWCHLYVSLLPQSTVLLRHLHSEWTVVSEKLPLDVLRETLLTFKVTNDEMSKENLRAEGLQECSRLCEALLSRMPSKASFPWRAVNFILLITVAAVVTVDVSTHGSFKGSHTGLFFRDIGALKYFEDAKERAKCYSLEAYRWSLNNLPFYFLTASEFAQPYVNLAYDFCIILWEYAWAVASNIAEFVLEKAPTLAKWIDTYAPGLRDAVNKQYNSTWEITKHYSAELSKIVVFYALEITHAFINFSIFAFEWVKTNVFVGNLSPENLQRYTQEALNTTHSMATNALVWISQKVVPSVK